MRTCVARAVVRPRRAMTGERAIGRASTKSLPLHHRAGIQAPLRTLVSSVHIYRNGSRTVLVGRHAPETTGREVIDGRELKRSRLPHMARSFRIADADLEIGEQALAALPTKAPDQSKVEAALKETEGKGSAGELDEYREASRRVFPFTRVCVRQEGEYALPGLRPGAAQLANFLRNLSGKSAKCAGEHPAGEEPALGMQGQGPRSVEGCACEAPQAQAMMKLAETGLPAALEVSGCAR